MSPYVAEFLGTALLVFVGNGVVANVLLPQTKGHGGGWVAITLGWGMAVFTAVWCFGPVSGGHLNPAVTLGLAAAERFAWDAVPGYIGAQLLGGVVGGVLNFGFYRDHYALCRDHDTVLATFCTAPAVRNEGRNLMCEALATMVLVLAVLMAVEPSLDFLPTAGGPAAGGDAQGATVVGLQSLGALPVGLLVLAIGLCLGGTTGYAINPARDLGPRIAHALLPISDDRGSDWGYAWVPVVGPLAGGLLAAALVRTLV